MSDPPIYPSLYQINTRAWLNELSCKTGVKATMDAVPEQALDEIAARGFDWVWLMGIWQTGHIGKQIASGIPQLRQEFKRILPDFTEEDICGSPFAVQEFHVHADFGGEVALQRFRQRLAGRGIHLLLDFVSNHTAIDHPWATLHPEYYIHGSQKDWETHPHDYVRLETSYGIRYLAHGRDPYFPPWSDTLQLNYRAPALRQAMAAELEHIAGMCDGLRCDMAMLLLPEVILKTWGEHSLPAYGNLPAEGPARNMSGAKGPARNMSGAEGPARNMSGAEDPARNMSGAEGSFWVEAIRRVKQKHADFLFMAEVYWDLEPRLLEQGFDYSYDKHLYDYLRAGSAGAVRQHLSTGLDYQRRLVRFLENHDEPRAAQAFPAEQGRAAALLCYLAPGLRFFQHGQLEGHRIRLPVQLCRAPEERCDEATHAFYATLLDLMHSETLRRGTWRLLPCLPNSPDDASWNQFIAYAWDSPGVGPLVVSARSGLPPDVCEPGLLVVVNYSAQPGRCRIQPWEDKDTSSMVFTQLMAGQPKGIFPQASGLSFDLPAWGYQVLQVGRET